MRVVEPQLDEYLRAWEPSAAGARGLAGLYFATLNQCVARRCIELLGASGRNGDTAAARAAAVLPSLADSNWTTPGLAFAHHVTLAGRDRAPHAARHVVDELERVAGAEVPELRLSPHDPVPAWVDGALWMFTSDQRRGGGQFVHARPITPDTATLEACEHALGLLDRCWPEMARTTETFVRELRWFVGPAEAVISLTLAQAFGAVFLVPTRSIALYEAIVHEATHLELMARMAIDKLMTNGRQRSPSPFRPDERPLTRVLHATLVAMRVVHALERCHDLLDPDDREIAERRRASFDANARNGLATLAEHAQWTPIGQELFDRMLADLAVTTAPNRIHASPNSP